MAHGSTPSEVWRSLGEEERAVDPGFFHMCDDPFVSLVHVQSVPVRGRRRCLLSNFTSCISLYLHNLSHKLLPVPSTFKHLALNEGRTPAMPTLIIGGKPCVVCCAYRRVFERLLVLRAEHDSSQGRQADHFPSCSSWVWCFQIRKRHASPWPLYASFGLGGGRWLLQFLCRRGFWRLVSR
jgi:hypothetical protein